MRQRRAMASTPAATALSKASAIGRIDIAGEGELGVATLDQVDHHRAMPCAHHVGHLGQMLDAALGDQIRKLGKAMRRDRCTFLIST